MNIVLIIATLGAGGAERVMCLLAGEWARRGNRVTLITLGAAGDDHYALPAEVRRVGLDALGASSGVIDAVKGNVRRLSRLRAAIKAAKPNVVISFMDATNVLTLMATASMHVPVIVSERIDPRHYPIARGWDWLRRRLYPTAGAVVVQTESVAEWARGFMPAGKVKVIANPVGQPLTEFRITNYKLRIEEPPSAGGFDKSVGEALSKDSDLPEWLPPGPFVLAMGRLDRQKGFDLLLRAFAELPEKYAGVSMVILGEGGERGALEGLARELGVADRVVMPGRIAEPTAVMARAASFVLSSRFEGFPNALLEAMAVGLPVVTFDCPSGPADIIRDEETGLLVETENSTGLATAMERVLMDVELRRRLGEAARTAMKDYSLDRITNEWEKLF